MSSLEVGELICSCCGCGIDDTPEQNVSHGELPYPHDNGYGLCSACGGDRKATGTDEKAVRKRLGWAGEAFFDTRIKTLAEALGEEKRQQFLAMPYSKKVAIIGKMVEKGYMT